MKIYKYLFGLLLLPTVFLTSCIDANTLEVLNESDTFRNIADAKNSVKGLYGKVMNLAEQTVVLNELRADLMDVTTNAGQDLQDISYFTSDASNPYANTVPYYSVIQNCNDILHHFDEMKANHLFTNDEYNELYSDVMTVRCWTYFQLGTLFGKIPYVTEPIKSLADLKIPASTYMDLDHLIPTLIEAMEALPTLEQYTNASGMNSAFNGHNLANYFINKRCLLAELYLWDNRYYDAAKTIRDFHRLVESNSIKYKNYSWVYQGSFVGSFAITYTRYLGNDVNSLVNLWTLMFSYPMENTYATNEHITCMTFDKSYEPTYPFIRLFGDEGAGKYLLKPSQNVIDNYWGTQVQSNGYVFDGRGKGGSYKEDVVGKPVITKYSWDYVPSKPYEVSGRWYIYRSGTLNLEYAEACNRYAETGGYVNGDTLKPVSAYRRLTRAFLNGGIPGGEFSFTKPNGTAYPGDSIAMSGWTGGKYFEAPFDFDGRMTDVPYNRGPWRSSTGIRSRASLVNAVYDTTATDLSEVRFWEKSILDEMALESAFEGHRWTDILRIAKRWNKEEAGSGTKLMNDLIGAKFRLNGKTAPVFLDDESNWYLPAKFE